MTTAQAFSEKLAERQAADQQEADEIYRQLVHSAAKGEITDPMDVMGDIEAAGRTADDFVADIEAIERRAMLASRIVDEAALYKEQSKLRQSIDKDRERIKVIEERILKTQGEWSHQSTLINRSRKAEAELVRSCTDPAKLEAFKGMKARLTRINEQKLHACDRLVHAREEASGLRKKLNSPSWKDGDESRESRQERLDIVTEEIATLESQIPDLERQKTGLLSQVTEYQNVLAAV